MLKANNFQECLAWSAGAVEYTDCISAEGQDPPRSKCPGYDIKPSDGEALENVEYPFIAITLKFMLTRVVAPDRILPMGQIELFDI